ncbi:MAG: hypothetical protein HY544_01520 [Candidatus Diapherotrites archaeon]|uniref:Uncharacterized protein n=1 Tax=Candidatus Iainarchaeum sp. TaxID=3101447 RepID=A0A8T3YKF6_9ARCH|nr:hypothetical protein [Candidatus Diapherotrites archaeon]
MDGERYPKFSHSYKERQENSKSIKVYGSELQDFLTSLMENRGTLVSGVMCANMPNILFANDTRSDIGAVFVAQSCASVLILGKNDGNHTNAYFYSVYPSGAQVCITEIMPSDGVVDVHPFGPIEHRNPRFFTKPTF